MPDSFLDRLKVEHKELMERINKLEPFLVTDSFEQLPIIDRTDLRMQLSVMQTYSSILRRRLERLSSAN